MSASFDFFHGISPKSSALRRAVAGSFLIVIACLTVACGGKSIAKVLTESEAIEILDVLRASGFDVAKEEVGEAEAKQWSVLVNENWLGGDEAALAIQVLRDHGLPRSKERGREAASDNQGMFPSESAQKAQRLNELKTEIERQLRILPGVTLVGVNVVLPEDKTISLEPYPATASVVIKHKDETFSFAVEQVQAIVARGVPNLKTENVSVTMAFQPPRPVARHEADARRRGQVITAGGIALVMVLGASLTVLWMQSRRPSGQLTDQKGGDQSPAEKTSDHESLPAQSPASGVMPEGEKGNPHISPSALKVPSL